MLSVIIPAYNAEAFIEECLLSVDRCMTCNSHACEVIVIDDGSTDGTADIARRHKNITLIQQPNRGLSAARNRGIDAAHGEWLMFVDADDCLLPGANDILTNLAETTGCLIAAGECVRGSNCPQGTHRRAPHTYVLSGPTAVEQTLYQQTPLLGSAWGKIWHRSLFDGLRFTEGLYYEDLDLFYKAFLKAGAVAVTSSPVYFYRIHGASFLRTFSDKILDVLTVTEQMETYMETLPYPSLLKAARDRRLSANFNIYNRICTRADADQHLADKADECWRTIKRLRLQSLLNPRVRFKNKLGVLATAGGRRLYNMMLNKLT